MSQIGKAKPSTHLITRPLLAGAVALSVLPAVDAQAAIFLQITGIQGESRTRSSRTRSSSTRSRTVLPTL